MAYSRHQSRRRTLMIPILCGAVSAALVATLTGCATPVTPQSNDAVLNVLTTTSVQIPTTVITRFKAKTGVTIHVTTTPDEQLLSTIRQASSGRFDAIVGLDLLDLTSLNARLMQYDSINGGHGSDDYAAAFGNSATATTHTAVCAQSNSASAVSHLKLSDLGTAKGKRQLTIASPASDRISQVWHAAIINTAGKPLWQRITAHQQPFTTTTETSGDTRPTWIAPIGQPFTLASNRGRPASMVTATTSTPHVIRGTCARWVQYSGILRDGTHINAAMKFVDALLTSSDQRDLAKTNHLYPVTNDVATPANLPDLDNLDLMPLSDADTAGIDQ